MSRLFRNVPEVFCRTFVVMTKIQHVKKSHLTKALTHLFFSSRKKKMMNIFMPLFSFYIAYTVPTAVGIYWMISSILSPVQQIALSKMYPIKEITPEEMREAERLYGGKQKKKKGTSNNPDGKKKKSLVYDDDDEYESVTLAPEKKVLKDKDSGESSVIEKAPRKEDE